MLKVKLFIAKKKLVGTTYRGSWHDAQQGRQLEAPGIGSIPEQGPTGKVLDFYSLPQVHPGRILKCSVTFFSRMQASFQRSQGAEPAFEQMEGNLQKVKEFICFANG